MEVELGLLWFTESGWMAQIVAVDTLDVVLTLNEEQRGLYYPQILWSPLDDLLAITAYRRRAAQCKFRAICSPTAFRLR